MKLSVLPLTTALVLMGAASSLRADVMLSNLGEPSEFNAYGAGLSAGTVFSTGFGRCTLNSVTLEQLFYDPAKPPQYFQVRVYQANYEAGNSSPNMTLIGTLGNPAVDPTPTQWPDATTFVVYSPLTAVTLEASTSYAITIGGAEEAAIGFTPSLEYGATAGWSMGGDLFGMDLGAFAYWVPTTDHLKFKIDASPALNQPPDISNAHASVPVLWPPDGRMVSFQIAGVTDPDGDSVSISITGVQQDEPPAFGKQGPNAVVDGTDTAAVRATRLGKGNGRVYKVFFTASDGSSDGQVEGVVSIMVPHDQAHPTAIDDGPTTGYYNSTTP